MAGWSSSVQICVCVQKNVYRGCVLYDELLPMGFIADIAEDVHGHLMCETSSPGHVSRGGQQGMASSAGRVHG